MAGANIDKLLQILQEKGLLERLSNKRINSPFLPATLYMKLLMAAIATNKPLSSVLSTALETYVMRNEEKHLGELKAIATRSGLDLEEAIALEIEKRLGQSKDE
jgi:hypothetical protein